MCTLQTTNISRCFEPGVRCLPIKAHDPTTPKNVCQILTSPVQTGQVNGPDGVQILCTHSPYTKGGFQIDFTPIQAARNGPTSGKHQIRLSLCSIGVYCRMKGTSGCLDRRQAIWAITRRQFTFMPGQLKVSEEAPVLRPLKKSQVLWSSCIKTHRLYWP